jgi:hypothetical protein
MGLSTSVVKKPYSAKCVEGLFSEVRIDGVLRSSLASGGQRTLGWIMACFVRFGQPSFAPSRL